MAPGCRLSPKSNHEKTNYFGTQKQPDTIKYNIRKKFPLSGVGFLPAPPAAVIAFFLNEL